MIAVMPQIENENSTSELSFLWLEITGKCNLTCTHCYADSGPTGQLYGEMKYSDWVRVLDEAADLGCQRVQFIGGEPTLHPRLHDLVDHASHRNYKLIEVFTNATRIGQDLLGCLQRNGAQLATSFYSDNPQTHETITQAKGSWERTVHGIQAALMARIPIRVGVIEMNANAGHSVRATEFLRQLGVERISVDRQRGVGRSEIIQLGERGELYTELCGQCGNGQLCVTLRGEVFPCVFSRRTLLGNIRSGLSCLLRGSKLKQFRAKLNSVRESSSSETICGPEEWCNPDQCLPGIGPCGPADCNPNLCMPGDGPCLPRG